MGSANTELSGPDFAEGIELSTLEEGKPLLGHASGEAVVLVRNGNEVFATGATCTHYSGPLAEGLVVGRTLRCPWHHACFSLRTGQPLRPPALANLKCWRVEQRDGRAFATDPLPAPAPQRVPTVREPQLGLAVRAGLDELEVLAVRDTSCGELERTQVDGMPRPLVVEREFPSRMPDLPRAFLERAPGERCGALSRRRDPRAADGTRPPDASRRTRPSRVGGRHGHPA